VEEKLFRSISFDRSGRKRELQIGWQPIKHWWDLGSKSYLALWRICLQ